MIPLPIVSLILGLFLLSSLALGGLILLDTLAERRLMPRRREDFLQLNLDSLIQELNATA